MEKRKAEIAPLKKILCTEAQERENNWWNKETTQEILERKIEAVYAQMVEYKIKTEELERKNIEILKEKIKAMTESSEGLDGNRSDIMTQIKESLLSYTEQIQTISQLRKRVCILKRENERIKARSGKSIEEGDGEGVENGSEKGANGDKGLNKKNDQIERIEEDVKKYIERIEELERQIEHTLSKHPPNYTAVVKALEIEVSDMNLTNKTLSEKIEDLIKNKHEIADAYEKEKQELLNMVKDLENEKVALESEIKHSGSVNSILKSRVDELYLVTEKIHATVIDKSREMEKENIQSNCTPECIEKITELQGKEIDRMEEIAYLVRKYIDATKENDELKSEISKSKKEQETNAKQSKIPYKKEDNTEDKLGHLRDEHKKLELNLQKLELDYLERKSSAQYHKRKSIQMEAELKAYKKSVTDLEKTISNLHSTIEKYKKQPTSFLSELDLYKKMIKCAVCTINIKNSILKKCMHIMCRECIEGRYTTRQRTCPLCGIVFSMNDVSHIYL